MAEQQKASSGMLQPLQPSQQAALNNNEPFRNPYEPVIVPQMPDMRGIPAELSAFRDQCASGA